MKKSQIPPTVDIQDVSMTYNNTPGASPAAPIMNNFLIPEDGGATDNASSSISKVKPSGGGLLSSLSMGLDQIIVGTNNSKPGNA